MFHEPFEIRPEFPFCRQHDSQGTQLRDKRLQGCGVRSLSYHMLDSHAPVCLFEGEMAKVGENEGEFLLVIGTPGWFPGILHEDNAKGLRVFPGEGTYVVCQLVIGDEEPAPPAWAHLPSR